MGDPKGLQHWDLQNSMQKDKGYPWVPLLIQSVRNKTLRAKKNKVHKNDEAYSKNLSVTPLLYGHNEK
jgi:hypothetical protein